jgi:hypothetical protein
MNRPNEQRSAAPAASQRRSICGAGSSTIWCTWWWLSYPVISGDSHPVGGTVLLSIGAPCAPVGGVARGLCRAGRCR